MAAQENAPSLKTKALISPSGFSVPELLLFLLTAFTAVIFLLGLPALYHRLTYPLQVEQGEAINVEKGLILLRGDNLYPDSSQGGPYLYSVYPPLFSWLEAGTIRGTGLIWQSGRFLAFAGYLGCGILLAAWGWRRWGRLWPVFLTLAFWVFPTWAEWGTMVRCDTLALFLHFGAFLLLYRDSMQPAGKKWVATAGFLTAASVLVKQDTLALLAVYGIYCLARRQWTRLGVYALSSLAPLALVFGIEQARTHGLFYDHTAAWLNTGFDADAFWYFLSKVFWREAGVVLLAVMALWVVKKVPLLLGIQMAFSILGLLSLGRSLGAENYWLGFLLYGVFFVGEAAAAPPKLAFPRLTLKAQDWGRAILGAALLISAMLGKWPSVPSEAEAGMKKEAAQMYESGENHLALDLDLPVMAGKKIWIQPAEYTAMVKRGIWSTAPLIRDIRARKFSTVELYDIPDQYLLPQPVVEEIKNNYHVKIREFGRIWFIPNG